jgi:hypothetical protein
MDDHAGRIDDPVEPGPDLQVNLPLEKGQELFD